MGLWQHWNRSWGPGTVTHWDLPSRSVCIPLRAHHLLTSKLRKPQSLGTFGLESFQNVLIPLRHMGEGSMLCTLQILLYLWEKRRETTAWAQRCSPTRKRVESRRAAHHDCFSESSTTVVSIPESSRHRWPPDLLWRLTSSVSQTTLRLARLRISQRHLLSGNWEKSYSCSFGPICHTYVLISMGFQTLFNVCKCLRVMGNNLFEWPLGHNIKAYFFRRSGILRNGEV